MYAIVDIETTGGHASGNGITEIAIVVHDGNKLIQTYETLIQPQAPIPYYIQTLTGIRPEMVKDAPLFEEVAEEIYLLLKDKIFVAHHVNFDYSFVKYHLEKAGYSLNCPKLCTVRLSRKIFAGLPSYSLGNLCRHFNITIYNRHRAGGDAAATAILFAKLLNNDREGHILEALKRGSKENILPPFLPVEKVKQLPHTPGVYYFHDQSGKVIYVGKAKNLRNRVNSHFSNNSPGRKKQHFLRNIYDISYQQCGTELMAFILEAAEIKRLWPPYNQAQKRFEITYALFAFEDRNGYHRLVIEKRRRLLNPLFTFNLLTEGYSLLRKLVREYQLCPRLCFLQKDNNKCTGINEGHCFGACEQQESPDDYNRRVNLALESLKDNLPSFAIIGKGRNKEEQSCILMERGRFYGMGYLAADIQWNHAETIKDALEPYPDNEYVRQLIRQHASRYPQQVLPFNNIVEEQLQCNG